MKKFLLFILALIALIVLVANIGPMIFLGASLFLLYVIFKQFMKSTSTGGKVMWVILGLIVLSIAVSNLYALIGIAAAYCLYVLYKKCNNEKEITFNKPGSDDPFTNFERQWADLNK
ncbi:lia operon protein LiaI [Evansella caseinilytica]|uniref:Lia operon protein LiaI n=1 Tax=Evansella caseinilytica TaxID=1503961 RepID=A0A1H3PW31_9BACI|nr:flagellar basal body rod protein [Evansella caseinilytica]SDZ04619.1 lia operon protein LiaI [Evansella caseinilytica]